MSDPITHLADEIEAELRAAFLDAIEAIRTNVDTASLIAAAERGDEDTVIAYVGDHLKPLRPILERAFTRSSTIAAGRLSLTFDPVDPTAVSARANAVSSVMRSIITDTATAMLQAQLLELELSGPILFDGFSFNLGAAYARARLSKDFELPAGLSGQVIPSAIRGRKGDRLPGAPDVSASGTITYKADFGGSTAITYSFGADYRSATLNQLGSGDVNTPTRRAAGYALLRASISAQRDGWTLDLYGTNLADKRAVLSANTRSLTSFQLLGDWGNAFAIVRPREIGLRLTRSF